MAKGDSRPVFFFDIDNCLYSSSYKIHHEMRRLSNEFIIKHLSLNPQEASILNDKYYKEYGLALEGLSRCHKIDPLLFNREVDDALPLDAILNPDPQLRALLMRLDTTKVKPWLFTNAYMNHARRVLRILGVDDLFEGITYCDYMQSPLICKPNEEIFARAEREAGASSVGQCYFVDDSYLNCKHAHARGWNAVHFLEPGLDVPHVPASKYMVSSLQQLPIHFPHFFKPAM